MPRQLPRRSRFVALIAVLAVLLSGCTAVTATTGSPGDDDTPPTIEEIAAVAATLPASDAEAAQRLVDDLFGSDRRTSLAATAELLVRSGIGLADGDGNLAAASDIVIADALVPLDSIASLTDSVRGGGFFATASVAALFTDLGFTTEPLTDEVLAATLRGWGKDAAALPQARIAGDAMRALADREGVLPIEGSSPRLDAISLYLVYAQVIGIAVETPADMVGAPQSAGAPGGAALAAAVVPAELSGEEAHCVAELQRLEKLGQKLLDKAEEIANKQVVKQSVETVGWAVEKGYTGKLNGEFLTKYSKLVGKTFEAIDTAVSLGQNVATTLLLIDGLAIEITDDHGGKMHFRHQSGDTGANIDVTARVTFNQDIVDQDQLACYKLIGVDVPANGGVSGKDANGEFNGWQVHWDFGENIGPNNYYGSVAHGDVIRPQNWEEYDKRGRNQPLDENGEAVMETMTRTEAEPEQGTEHTVSAEVVATVELVKAPKPTISTADMTVQLAVAVAQAIAFPSARHTIEVTYHGQDAYSMTGDGRLSFLVAEMDFTADYYSCNGLTGPWSGSAGYAADASALGLLAQKLGYSGATTGTFTDDTTRFNLNEQVTEPQQIPLGQDGFGLQATLQNVPQRGEHIDGYIGTATWLMPGSGTALDRLFSRIAMGAYSSGITYDIRGVPDDPRCPGARFEDDRWDD